MAIQVTEKDSSPKMRANAIFWFKRDKERQRFYLFAGMGGRAARRKHKLILKWSLVIGIVVSGVLATALYFMNQAGK
jgi:hypothetical protein